MKYVLIGLLKLYRLLISPLYGNVCRYYPSCSAYALRAVEVHGAARGSWLAVCGRNGWREKGSGRRDGQRSRAHRGAAQFSEYRHDNSVHVVGGVAKVSAARQGENDGVVNGGNRGWATDGAVWGQSPNSPFQRPRGGVGMVN